MHSGPHSCSVSHRHHLPVCHRVKSLHKYTSSSSIACSVSSGSPDRTSIRLPTFTRWRFCSPRLSIPALHRRRAYIPLKIDCATFVIPSHTTRLLTPRLSK
jgi:hypothetical protein